jgi:hypothetical protein
MTIKQRLTARVTLLITLVVLLTVVSTRQKADTGTCGGVTVTLPFMDVMDNPFFCQIAAAYFSGLTNGTSATTYSPGLNVTRDQMAAFITRTQDSALKRGSTRGALNQWWTTTPHYDIDLGTTTVGPDPGFIQSDGVDLWVASEAGGGVGRVRASDGKLLGTWTNIAGSFYPLVAMGRIFVVGRTTPGLLYMIDPTQTPGAATEVANSLGSSPWTIAFDGNRIWSANLIGNSVSIVTPGATIPWAVTEVSGFNHPQGILFDGANIWITERRNIGAGSLVKLDSNGGILQTVPVGNSPFQPIYDGTNIWVPNSGSNSITVVRASTGGVLATLTGNGLNVPFAAAFDGERILVTNYSGDSVSLWKAADLTPIGSFSTGAGSYPLGACSDGLNFWVVLNGKNKLARF